MRDMGTICINPYKLNTTAVALNMNDKVYEILEIYRFT